MIKENTAQKHYIGLDVMRAIAAILIVVYHYDVHKMEGVSKATKIFFGGLWSTVDLFFVLSGFLIASGWFKELKSNRPNKFRNFYVKRFFRILPLYYLVLFFFWAKSEFIMNRDYNPWRFIFFVQNYVGDLGNFSVSWSLAVEEHFYLIFPLSSLLLLKLISQKKITYVWPILIIIVGIMRYLKTDEVMPMLTSLSSREQLDLFEKAIYIPTHMRFDGLLFGVTLASIRVFHPKMWARLKEYKMLFYSIGIALLVYSFIFSADRYSFASMSFSFSAMALSFSILLIPLFHEEFNSTKIINKVTVHFAKLSYPLYLVHFPCFYVVDVILSKTGITNGPGLLHFIFTMLIIYIAALMSNLLIEDPMLKLRNRFLK